MGKLVGWFSLNKYWTNIPFWLNGIGTILLLDQLILDWLILDQSSLVKFSLDQTYPTIQHAFINSQYHHCLRSLSLSLSLAYISHTMPSQTGYNKGKRQLPLYQSPKASQDSPIDSYWTEKPSDINSNYNSSHTACLLSETLTSAPLPESLHSTRLTFTLPLQEDRCGDYRPRLFCKKNY